MANIITAEQVNAKTKLTVEQITTIETQLTTASSIVSFLEKQLNTVNKGVNEITAPYNKVKKEKVDFESEFSLYLSLPLIKKPIKTINDKISFVDNKLAETLAWVTLVTNQINKARSEITLYQEILANEKAGVAKTETQKTAEQTSTVPAGISDSTEVPTSGIQYTYDGFVAGDTITVTVNNNAGLDKFSQDFSTVTYTIDTAKANIKGNMDSFGDYKNGISYPKTGTPMATTTAATSTTTIVPATQPAPSATTPVSSTPTPPVTQISTSTQPATPVTTQSSNPTLYYGPNKWELEYSNPATNASDQQKIAFSIRLTAISFDLDDEESKSSSVSPGSTIADAFETYLVNISDKYSKSQVNISALTSTQASYTTAMTYHTGFNIDTIATKMISHLTTQEGLTISKQKILLSSGGTVIVNFDLA